MTIKKEKIANHSGNLGEFSKWIERQREEGRNLAAVSRDFFRMQRRRRPHRRGDFRNSNILAGEHRSYPRNPAGFAREDDLPSLVKTIEGGKRAARGGRKRALVIVERRRIVFWRNGDLRLTNSNSNFYGGEGQLPVCASCIFEEIRFKRHGERMLQAWCLTNRIDVFKDGSGMKWVNGDFMDEAWTDKPEYVYIYRFSKNFRNGYTFLFIRFCMICLLEFFLYIYLWNIFFFHFCKVVEGWTFMMRIINIRVLMRFGTRSNFFWFENYLKFMSKS